MKALAAVTAALLTATSATAADEAAIRAWWRGYQAAPFAKAADGRNLRYYCQGSGSPVVVLEAGLGDGAWTWRFVQPDIARTTRVCSYDRAGYGLSDEATGARDVNALASDLAAVVKAAGGGKPVVLVGHSLGGPIVRQFAYQHPKLTAGLVLVDPSADHQVERFTAVVSRFPAMSAANGDQNRACLALLAKGPFQDGTPGYVQCVGPPPADMPRDLVHFHVAYGQSPIHHRAILAELAGAFSEGSTKQADATRRPLGATPLIVLTAGEPNPSPLFTAEERSRFDATWRLMHWEMLELSSNSRRRFVDGAGHYIQADKPRAVVQAVNDVVSEVRSGVR